MVGSRQCPSYVGAIRLGFHLGVRGSKLPQWEPSRQMKYTSNLRNLKVHIQTPQVEQCKKSH
jgi:hypothetical protein